MMVLTGRLTYITIWEIIEIASMKQQVVREQAVFSVDLVSRKTNSGL